MVHRRNCIRRPNRPPLPLRQTEEVHIESLAMYHKLLGERANKAMDEKVHAGGYVGRAPIGYLNVLTGQRTTIEVNIAIVPLIVEGFEIA